MINKTVLLTGATGFIGKNLLPILQNNYNNVYFDKFDICNIDIVSQVMLDVKPNIIIHLAAKTTLNDDWKTTVDTNIGGTSNLLYVSPKQCRFVFISTVNVYGNGIFKKHNTYLNPTSIYASTKLAAEKLVNIYTTNELVNGVILRLCATVGKNMTHGMLKNLMNKAKQNSSNLEIMGNYPGSNRPYIHVDDAINAILILSQENITNGECNFVPQYNATIDEITTLILNQVSKNIKQKIWTGQNIIGDIDILEVCPNLNDYNLTIQYQTSLNAIKQGILDNLDE